MRRDSPRPALSHALWAIRQTTKAQSPGRLYAEVAAVDLRELELRNHLAPSEPPAVQLLLRRGGALHSRKLQVHKALPHHTQAAYTQPDSITQHASNAVSCVVLLKR